jgi:hypothetical protein
MADRFFSGAWLFKELIFDMYDGVGGQEQVVPLDAQRLPLGEPGRMFDGAMAPIPPLIDIRGLDENVESSPLEDFPASR